MQPLYIGQVAFTTGEVSPDVSSRFDLEQYKSALLLAENAVIRPMVRWHVGKVVSLLDMQSIMINQLDYLNLRQIKINRSC